MTDNELIQLGKSILDDCQDSAKHDKTEKLSLWDITQIIADHLRNVSNSQKVFDAIDQYAEDIGITI